MYIHECSLFMKSLFYDFAVCLSVCLSVCVSPVKRPPRRKLEDCYEIGLVLGNGGFGSVYSGKSLTTGENVGYSC